MIEPQKPDDEEARLLALYALKILDTPTEERFDRITRLLKYTLSSPIALISIVDDERQWFKSKQGLDADETPRNISFCGHAILDNGIFYIPNATEDARFADNPLVTGPPQIRSYAGAPLRAPSGQRIGTLCAIDDHPTQLTKEQLQSLRDLADVVESELARTQMLKYQTQLAQKEQSLRSYSDRLRLATRAANIGIWDYDIQNNCLSWDERMFELYGVDQDSFPGAYEAWENALHPDDKINAVAEINDAIAGGRDFDTEFRISWPDKSVHHIMASATVIRDEDGKAKRMIGVNLDITKRKNLELATQHYRSLVLSSMEGIIGVDNVGIITSWNPGAEVMFGHTGAEAIGTPILSLLSKEQSHTPENIAEKLFSGTQKSTTEMQVLTKVNRFIDIELIISPIFNESDRQVGVSIIAHDITERKKLDRLKSEFVSTVSHELRTPLTSIHGALSLVLGKETQQLSRKARTMLELAERNTERLGHLLNDILDLEKIEAGKLEFDFKTKDLLAISRRSIEENSAFANSKNITIDFESSLKTAEILGDEHRLMQVYANLLSNAIKFSPENSKVKVSIELNDGYYRVKIADSGPGIPDSFKSMIFERFAQADSSDSRSKGGSGLGLNICRAIIERHGGKIDYHSKADQGATFYFDLQTKGSYDKTSPATRGTTRKVLICEDNHDVALVLSNMLEREGMAVEIAPSGEDALEKSQTSPFALILLDLNLPDMDGFSVLTALKEQQSTSDIPVVIISARDRNQELVTTNKNVVEWIQKPISQKHLRSIVQQTVLTPDTPHILHVEDDADTIQVVRELVSDFSYYTYASTLQQARSVLAEQQFDLMLLDVGLADGSGLELLNDVNGQYPVIIFSGTPPDNTVPPKVAAVLEKSSIHPEQLISKIKSILDLRHSV